MILYGILRTSPEVWVLALLGCQGENLLDKLLGVGGPLQEELHDGGEQLQLHLRVLVVEVVQEALEQLVSVVDPLSVLADDPDHGGARLWLVQGVQVLTEGGDDGLVLVGVFAEDVLDHYHRLLHHVVDLGLDQIKQSRDTDTLMALLNALIWRF